MPPGLYAIALKLTKKEIVRTYLMGGNKFGVIFWTVRG